MYMTFPQWQGERKALFLLYRQAACPVEWKAFLDRLRRNWTLEDALSRPRHHDKFLLAVMQQLNQNTHTS